MSRSNGMIRIHRIVGAEIAGRELTSSDHTHHDDNDPLNWRRSNIIVTTASDHASIHATERNKGKRVEVLCAGCEAKITRILSKVRKAERFFCSRKCMDLYHGIEWPSNDELYQMIWGSPMRDVAKVLGVSDVAVKKHCKRESIDTPPRGYWLRKRQKC